MDPSPEALSIARKLRLNIRLNWRKDCFYRIAVRLWGEAKEAGLVRQVMGFLTVLD